VDAGYVKVGPLSSPNMNITSDDRAGSPGGSLLVNRAIIVSVDQGLARRADVINTLATPSGPHAVDR
jgi:hypothetical protein